MSERIPTDVLVEEARTWLLKLPNAWPARSTIAALADRLDELAALEPVGRVLAVMAKLAEPAVLKVEAHGRKRQSYFGDLFTMAGGWQTDDFDTPEAALAALAEQVRA